MSEAARAGTPISRVGVSVAGSLRDRHHVCFQCMKGWKDGSAQRAEKSRYRVARKAGHRKAPSLVLSCRCRDANIELPNAQFPAPSYPFCSTKIEKLQSNSERTNGMFAGTSASEILARSRVRATTTLPTLLQLPLQLQLRDSVDFIKQTYYRSLAQVQMILAR